MGELTSIFGTLGIDREQFRNEYSGRQYLLVRASEFPVAEYRQGIMDILAQGVLRSSSIRVVKSGKAHEGSLGLPAAGDDRAADPYVEPRILARALSDGYTIVVRSLHRYCPPVASLAAGIASDTGCRVRVNSYITPPEAKGLNLHYDIHDAFVIQVSGTKDWVICEPALKWPVAPSAWRRLHGVRGAAHAPDVKEIAKPQLSEGDILYLPRGFLHSAQTKDGLSIHLTISLHSVTRRDVLAALVRQLEEQEWFRQDVDTQMLLGDPAAAEAELRLLISRMGSLLDSLPATRVVWEAAGSALDEYPVSAVSLVDQVTAVNDIDRFRSYIKPAGVTWYIEDGKDCVVLHTNFESFRFPAGARGLVDAIMGEEIVEPQKLYPSYPASEVRSVIRSFLQSGILQPEEDQAARK